MAGTLPIPLNSCTSTWRSPETTGGRLINDVRIHPQGGLEARCDDNCDDIGRGLAICLANPETVEDPPNVTTTNTDGDTVTLAHTDGLRISTDGCLWIKPSLGERFKKTVGAQVEQPTSIAQGAIAQVGTPTTITVTNDTAEPACYSILIDICNAFIDSPTPAVNTAEFPTTDVEVTSSQLQLSGDAETVTVPARTITLPAQQLDVTSNPGGAVFRVTFNNRTCAVFAAGARDYAAYSGRISIGEIQIEPGQTFTSDLVTDILGRGNVVDPFTVSTGEICVLAERVACAAMEC